VSSDAQLDAYRASIDNIDAALVHLLAERFKITQAVGQYKSDVGMPPADPDREQQQIARPPRPRRGVRPRPRCSPEKFLRFIVDEVILHHKRIAAPDLLGAATGQPIAAPPSSPPTSDRARPLDL
jgi:chorismate mutase